MRFPLDQRIITAHYHQRMWYGIHQGVDYRASYDLLYAPQAGTIKTWYDLGGGRTIDLYVGSVMYRFMHLYTYSVPNGSYVGEGQIIATTGNSGITTTAPHLHHEVWVNGQRVDPEKYYNQHLNKDILKEIDMNYDELVERLKTEFVSRDARINFDPRDGSIWICNNFKKYKLGTMPDDWKVLASAMAKENISDEERRFPTTKKRGDVL